MKNQHCSSSFTVTITDGDLERKEITFLDPKVTGQQVIEQAGYFPAGEYIILEREPNGMLEEINLRETIDLSKDAENSIFLYKADRIYYAELNGRRFPCGKELLSESDIRVLGNIPDSHQVFLEQREGSDLLINGCSTVDLSQKGLEKVYSVKKKLTIIVNGRPQTVEKEELGFLELIKLAFPSQTICANSAYTITYTKGCSDKPIGSMVQGDSVCLQDGEVFNVTATNKS